MAVLTWLALRPHRRATRDRIIGVFWGERDEARARNSLSDALSHLRRVLGTDAIITRADDVLIAADAPLEIDVHELHTAAAAGDHARVIELYEGPFLDGMHIGDSAEFGDWRDREANRLRELFARSVAAEAQTMSKRHEWEQCRRLCERWLDAEPASADAAVMMLDAMRAAGTYQANVAALTAWEALVQRLDRELGLPPDPRVAAVAAEIRLQLNTVVQEAETTRAEVESVAAPRSAGELSRVDSSDMRTAVHLPRRRGLIAAVVVVIALSLVAIGASTLGRTSASERRVLVSTLQNLTGDSALMPFGRIASDWIARGLLATNAVEVVDPITPADTAETTDPRSFARTVGAGTVVAGGYYLSGDSLMIDVRIVDVASGRVRRAIESATLRTRPDAALAELRQRVAGALAAELDPVIGGLARESSQPPTYAAYVEWIQGLDAFSHRDFVGSIPFLERAARLDSAFLTPRIWQAAAYANTNQYRAADSIFTELNAVRDRLTPFDRSFLDMWRANVRGDGTASYRHAREVMEIAPASELALYLAGLHALYVNRIDDAIDALQRIPVERSSAPWDVYGTKLSMAYHMGGRYTEELREARRRSTREPTSFGAISEEARALLMNGRMDEMYKRVANVAAISDQPGRTPGSVLLTIGEELLVHGEDAAARTVLLQAEQWARARAQTTSSNTPRYLRARALYYLGDLARADSLLRAVAPTTGDTIALLTWRGLVAARAGSEAVADSIDSALRTMATPYLRGRNTLARARIAALRGRAEESVRLLRQAVMEGATFDVIHGCAELRRLQGYAPFDELMRPR